MAAIARVEVGRFDYDLVGEFKFFKDGVRPSVVVRLTDENGVQGWGQSVPVETWTYETVESVETTLRHYLAPAILGADPPDLAGLHERMDRAIRPSFSVGQPLCKAAVDLACYDLWGKQTGRSVSDLLGGAKRNDVKLSWTIQAPTLAAQNSSSRSAARRLRQLQHQDRLSADAGIRPGARAHGVQFRARRLSLDGRQHQLRPGHRAGDGAEARGRRPQGAGVAAAAEPHPRLSDAKRQGALPILMDEGIVSPVEVAEFIALDMFDGIAMKVARCGGLWNASRIVTLLRDNDLLAVRLGPDRSRSVAGGVRHLFAWAGLEHPRRAQRAAICRRHGARPIRHSAPTAT